VRRGSTRTARPGATKFLFPGSYFDPALAWPPLRIGKRGGSFFMKIVRTPSGTRHAPSQHL
jgi:hypothetical protein